MVDSLVGVSGRRRSVIVCWWFRCSSCSRSRRPGRAGAGRRGEDAGGGSSAVGFEGELAFQGLVDRLDPLADAAEVAVGVGLVLAVRTQQGQPQRLGEVLELLAGEALVGEQDLTGAD